MSPVRISAPAFDRGAGQPVGHRTHAADRDVPVAGAATDEVVEEADVLAQVGPAHLGEGADEGVGRDDAAHRVVAERALEDLPQRAPDQRLPERVVADQRRDLGLGAQRLEDGREDLLREVVHPAVEVLPRGILPGPAGEGGEAGRGRLRVTVVDEQAAAGVAGHRREGGVAPPDQPHVEVEVGDHLPGQQRDEVGVARQPRVDPGKACAETAAPPTWSAASSTSTRRPARARYAAAVSPL